LVAALGETVRSTFPVPSELLRRALEEGTAWPGDGILWMAGGPKLAGGRAHSRGIADTGGVAGVAGNRDVAGVVPDEQGD
jgi:hypothetical protein